MQPLFILTVTYDNGYTFKTEPLTQFAAIMKAYNADWIGLGALNAFMAGATDVKLAAGTARLQQV